MSMVGYDREASALAFALAFLTIFADRILLQKYVHLMTSILTFVAKFSVVLKSGSNNKHFHSRDVLQPLALPSET
jgi:hypothetical protein